MNNQTYLIVDDHPLTADGIRHQVIAARPDATVEVARSLADASAVFGTLAPDLVCLDMSLPDGDGISFFHNIAAVKEPPKGILLSGMLNDVDIQRAITAGFSAILTKGVEGSEIETAIERVESGEPFYSEAVRPIVENLSGGDLFTPRMIEVLAMLQDGASNKQIAAEIGVSEATVSFHINQIKTRLGARTNRQIIAQARKLGISLSRD